MGPIRLISGGFDCSPVEADAAGNEVAAPVVEAGEIAIGRVELEVASFVAGFDVEAGEVVSDRAAERVAVIELGIGIGDDAVGGFAIARIEFGDALGADEGAAGLEEFVFRNNGQFKEEHVVADEKLAIDLAGGLVDFAGLAVESNHEIAEVELGTDEESKLNGVSGSVVGNADFAARDEAGLALFAAAAKHGDPAIDDGFERVAGGQAAVFVSGLAEVDAESGALAEGRDGKKR